MLKIQSAPKSGNQASCLTKASREWLLNQMQAQLWALFLSLNLDNWEIDVWALMVPTSQMKKLWLSYIN